MELNQCPVCLGFVRSTIKYKFITSLIVDHILLWKLPEKACKRLYFFFSFVIFESIRSLFSSYWHRRKSKLKDWRGNWKCWNGVNYIMDVNVYWDINVSNNLLQFLNSQEETVQQTGIENDKEGNETRNGQRIIRLKLCFLHLKRSLLHFCQVSSVTTSGPVCHHSVSSYDSLCGLLWLFRKSRDILYRAVLKFHCDSLSVHLFCTYYMGHLT